MTYLRAVEHAFAIDSFSYERRSGSPGSQGQGTVSYSQCDLTETNVAAHTQFIADSYPRAGACKMRPTGESGRLNANTLNTAAALVRALGSYVTVSRIRRINAMIIWSILKGCC